MGPSETMEKLTRAHRTQKLRTLVPRKHTGLCTLKSQVVSRTLKNLDPPMAGEEGARVLSPLAWVPFALLSRAATVRAGE